MFISHLNYTPCYQNPLLPGMVNCRHWAGPVTSMSSKGLDFSTDSKILGFSIVLDIASTPFWQIITPKCKVLYNIYREKLMTKTRCVFQFGHESIGLVVRLSAWIKIYFFKNQIPDFEWRDKRIRLGYSYKTQRYMSYFTNCQISVACSIKLSNPCRFLFKAQICPLYGPSLSFHSTRKESPTLLVPQKNSLK